MNLENCDVHIYTSDIFAIQSERGQKSQFDEKLQSTWQDSMDKGYFRYGLRDVKTKHIPGKYGFIAQLNIRRAIDRRKPQFISDIKMPFDPDIFHFGKVAEHEILFLLNPLHWENEDTSESVKTSNALIINVSPLEFCHSLLVPGIEKGYPQVLNFNGLRLALETMLISYNSSLKVGYNSLGAYASVNHLHFHIYYLKEDLYLQYAPVKRIVGDCYELADFPAEGFAFQLVKSKAIIPLVRTIMKLINFLLAKKIPHNVFMTRGQEFSETSRKKTNFFNVIRIYVWAREASFGSKIDIALNPAVCELGGHLPIKDKAYFDTAQEDNISDILKNACQEMFRTVKEEIKNIYTEC